MKRICERLSSLCETIQLDTHLFTESFIKSFLMSFHKLPLPLLCHAGSIFNITEFLIQESPQPTSMSQSILTFYWNFYPSHFKAYFRLKCTFKWFGVVMISSEFDFIYFGSFIILGRRVRWRSVIIFLHVIEWTLWYDDVTRLGGKFIYLLVMNEKLTSFCLSDLLSS